MVDVVGVIGLGIMGGAMSRNLIANGISVVGYDPSESAGSKFREMGGELQDSIADVVAKSSTILLTLPTVEALLSASQAIADVQLDGKIVIELGVMPLSAKIQARTILEQSGCTLLDCPVSGTGSQAQTGDLVVFASGPQSAYEQVKTIFGYFSRKSVYLGEFGNGSKMKFIANHLVAVHNAAAAEAFTLADKAGIDRRLLYDALGDSAATSRMFQIRGPLMVANDYSQPTARISMFMKDLDIISDFAAKLSCPTPLFGVTTQLYFAAQNLGLGDMDTAAVCKVLEVNAGVPRSCGAIRGTS